MGTLLIKLSFEKNIPAQQVPWTYFLVSGSFLQGSRHTNLSSIPGAYWRQMNTFFILSPTWSPNQYFHGSQPYALPLQRINLLSVAALQIWRRFLWPLDVFSSLLPKIPRFFKMTANNPDHPCHPPLVCPYLFKLTSEGLNEVLQ